MSPHDPPSAPVSSRRRFDPILTNALRYTISADEYHNLHNYLATHAPLVKRRAPEPVRYNTQVTGSDDHTVASIRASFRLLVVVYGGFKAWDILSQRLLRKTKTQTGAPRSSHPNIRVAASLSLILLFHRLLRRFVIRLGASLQESSAQGFRRRNVTLTSALTSRYSPSIIAALAGLFLRVAPRSQLRTTIAIYALTRCVEFAYNAADEKGLIWGRHGRPSWVGTWMFVPFAYGQVLHAFVFDRDCFPDNFGGIILNWSPGYIRRRPTDLPTGDPWPGTFQIVDGLAALSKLGWPAFGTALSASTTALTTPDLTSLRSLESLIATAKQAIKHPSCAILHPQTTSCTRVQLSYFLGAFPKITRFFTLVYGGLALLSYRSLLRAPLSATLNRFASRVLRMALFVTGAIGTSWSSICFFSHCLPNHFLATQRWFVGGFIAGLWAFVARRNERGNFLYSIRMSIDSCWKVGVKRGWWTGISHGDVLMFAVCLGIVNVVYDARPRAVRGSVVRKSLGVLRGEGWVDAAGSLPSTEAESATTGLDHGVPESKPGHGAGDGNGDMRDK